MKLTETELHSLDSPHDGGDAMVLASVVRRLQAGVLLNIHAAETIRDIFHVPSPSTKTKLARLREGICSGRNRVEVLKAWDAMVTYIQVAESAAGTAAQG